VQNDLSRKGCTAGTGFVRDAGNNVLNSCELNIHLVFTFPVTKFQGIIYALT
jgi:hypothetical protein